MGDTAGGRAAKLVAQVTQAAGDALSPGESIVAAVRVNLKGTVAATAGGALGGAAGAIAGSKALAEGAEEAAAAGFPTTAQQALGVTDRAVVVTSRSGLSGKPKAYLASIPLSDIESVTLEPGRMGDALTFAMRNGTSTTFQAVKVDPGASFAEAVQQRLAT
jgi:hypothetical protein